MTIEFHEQAASRFNELAQELLAKVRTFAPPQPRPKATTSIHPVAKLSEKDVIGVIDWKQRSVNGFGEETGRYWDASSGHIGYEAEEYAAKDLAKRLEQATPLKNRVSERFLLDELFAWLQGTLESKREYPFIDFLAKKSSEAIAVHEIWICAHE
jgi:hypothetical protein